MMFVTDFVRSVCSAHRVTDANSVNALTGGISRDLLVFVEHVTKASDNVSETKSLGVTNFETIANDDGERDSLQTSARLCFESTDAPALTLGELESALRGALDSVRSGYPRQTAETFYIDIADYQWCPTPRRAFVWNLLLIFNDDTIAMIVDKYDPVKAASANNNDNDDDVVETPPPEPNAFERVSKPSTRSADETRRNRERLELTIAKRQADAEREQMASVVKKITARRRPLAPPAASATAAAAATPAALSRFTVPAKPRPSIAKKPTQTRQRATKKKLSVGEEADGWVRRFMEYAKSYVQPSESRIVTDYGARPDLFQNVKSSADE
jgi:hypothetical protein